MSRPRFIAPPLSDALDAAGQSVVYSEALLWAGDLVASADPVRLSTVLGSCVAVCLYDPIRRAGGMNHFLVPRGGASAMHGDWATAQLVERMIQLGSSTSRLQAKLFGGGAPLRLANERFAVGEENVAIARRVLAERGIPVIAERVGHGAGLRLFFENWSSVVWVRLHAEHT